MKKITTNLPQLRLLILPAILIGVMFTYTNAQVNPTCFPATATVPGFATDFDSLANSGTSAAVPTGFGFDETGGGTNDNDLYAAGTGSSTTGDTYSFGAAGDSERAFGGLQSGTLIPLIGACIVNNTGATINAITVTYDGEQWRLGTAGREDRLDFEYSTDATSLTTGSWTAVDALDFIAPVTALPTGALDGNAPANRTAGITSSIPGLSIAPGGTFYLRFVDFNASGSDDGLAIDNFSIVGFPNLAASAEVGGRVTDGRGTGVGKIQVIISGGDLEQPVTALTSSFGYFSFEVPAGRTYTVSVRSGKHTFLNSTQVITVNDNVTDLNFTVQDR